MRISMLLLFILYALPLTAIAAVTAIIVPASVPGGSVVTTTVTVVASSGLVTGAQIAIDLPANWNSNLQTTCPTCNGYVTLSSTATATFSALSISTSGVKVGLQGGFLSAGSPARFLFQAIYSGCPFTGQTAASWNVRLSTATNAAFQMAAATQTYTAGTAQYIGFNANNVITVAGQPSPALIAQPYNSCGQVVQVSTAVSITLSGQIQNTSNFSYAPDASALFSTTSNFASTTTAVTLAALSTAVTFYYETAASGAMAIQVNYLIPTNTNSQQAWLYLNSLATAPGFSKVSVDNGTPVPGQTHVTITPDGTGTNNFATIRFFPSTAAQQWHVSISSNNFLTTVYERWGSGDPQGNVGWNGQTYAAGNTGFTSQVVPNGTYAVKIDFSGLVTNASLTIAVQTAQIAGTVMLAGVPVAGAIVAAQGAGINNSVTTDAGGNYIINGLHAGNSYNVYATYTNPINRAVVTGQKNNVAAGLTGQDFSLSTPAIIRIAALAASPATAAVYGNLNLHSADYSQNYFGNLRLQSGATTSDNGDSFSPSTWTVFYVSPNTAYTIHLNMPGYGATDVMATNSTDVLLPLTQEANIYGLITLPSPATVPFYASVSATPKGTSLATGFGGAAFQVGQSTAIYSLFAILPGTYTLQAQINGYVPATLSNVVVGVVDLGNVLTGGQDFPAVTVGGTISGTLTINGDTSGLNNLALYINAYSPASAYNLFSQIQMATSTTQTSASYQIGGVADGTYQMYSPYLQGFDPATFGQTTVVVHNGVGTANFALTQETGRIIATVLLPNGQTDYTNVHLSISGPGRTMDQDLTAHTLTIPHLGTGFFAVTAIYKTTGAQSVVTLNLTNGQTAPVVIDLSAPTYAISGVVSVQSAFAMKGSTVAQVSINTVSDLLANATNQNIFVGGTGTGNNVDCTLTPPVSTSTARVEAFPKNFQSYGGIKRSGLSNCFALGGYYFGVINADGSYSIPHLSPGVWEVDVYPYFDNGQTPNAAAQTQFVTLTNGDVGSTNFLLSAGNTVSGTVNLPSGVTDTRSFSVQISDSKGNTIQAAALQLGDAGSPAATANFSFANLPSGQYSLLIQDPGTYDVTLNQNVIKYVSAPVQFKINGADIAGLSVAMARAARMVGTIGIQTVAAGGALSLTLITPNNASLLPSGFQIYAQANPWIAGGSQSAQFSTDGSNRPAIDANNRFVIDGLATGTYDVRFQQNTYGISVQAAGSLNLAAFTQGSIHVISGQTVDIGTVILKPGLSVSGTVADTSGNPLSNIIVRASPSSSNHGNDSLEATTDAQGQFTLLGLNPDLKIYDVVAAPRPGNGDSTRAVPYGQVQRLAVNVAAVPAPTLDFVLTRATAQLSGRILTADGGNLSFPQGDQAGYPAADVFLHLEGTNTDDNPLGQDTATRLDGTFTIDDLVPGLYDITVESLGYQPFHITGILLLDGGTKDIGTITLQKGAELDATLVRPDGSLVNTAQVETVVAVNQDLSSIIFGQVDKDASSGNILALKFSGFQTSPQVYNVLLFDKQNNITSPVEGSNLIFVSSSDVITRVLTYTPSPPFAFTDIKRAGPVGTPVTITYYFSRPLRNRGDDNDPRPWFTFPNAHGRLSGYQISGDRTQLTVIYTPSAGEQNATLAFSAHTVDLDPTTGTEYGISKTITLLLGQKATVESNINPVLGGTISLAQSQDPTNVFIPANAFLTSTGSVVNAAVSYRFTLTATDDVSAIASVTPDAVRATGVRRTAYASLLAYGAPAYVSESYQAITLASHDATLNPLSSFYSILLPAGISHNLNGTAYITLSYDTASDPNLINVYYFNGLQYFIQNTARTIDVINHTITVGVNHFSTFVVLENAAPTIIPGGANTSGGGINVFNFPNPFNLESKTLALSYPGTQGSITTQGTVIRYSVPAANVGPATLRFYDVVGKKVRTIDLGTPLADTYSYVAWDGTNDAGRPVASGVYIGVLDVRGEKTFWKLAVIK